MRDDPTIARIREARHRISAEHDHDPRKVVDYYMELQEKYRDRLVESSESSESKEKSGHTVEAR